MKFYDSRKGGCVYAFVFLYFICCILCKILNSSYLPFSTMLKFIPIRKDMDVNEHEGLSNIILRHKLK